MGDTLLEKGSGFIGEHRVMLPERMAATLMRQKPLLSGLFAAGAGYFPRAEGHLRRRPKGTDQAIFIYCVKGGGWCQLGGARHTVRAGDLLVIPSHQPHSYGANTTNPWTIHYVHALGSNVREYLRELGVSVKNPVTHLGMDMQLALLFNEVAQTLERGLAYLDLLQASHTLGHLLALLIRHRYAYHPDAADGLQKVAQCIVYMSEHLDQPLKVSRLAALSNLSTPHFTVLFKQQTGSAPRDYLHLLRIHRACQLLHGTTLNMKDIAAQLGYQDPFHFSKRFKQFQGVSPSEYRAAHGSER
ncbi:MAG: AraC family transcriptional regulator [Verrucomicrobiota bacterium]